MNFIFSKYSTIILILLFSSSISAYSQTIGSRQHDAFNEQAYNPAYIGSKNFVNLNLSAMAQHKIWRIDGSPRQYMLSFSTPIRTSNLFLGLTYENESIGIHRRGELLIHGAYLLRLTDKSNLSLGIESGIHSLRSEFSSIILIDEPILQNEDRILSFIRGGLGAYYFDDAWFGGFSIRNFSSAPLQELNVGEEELNISLKYFAKAGRLFTFDDNFQMRTYATVSEDANAYRTTLSAHLILWNLLYIGPDLNFNRGTDVFVMFQIADIFKLGFHQELPSSFNDSHLIGEAFIGINFNGSQEGKTPLKF